MKNTYTVGQGFPQRLRSALLARNLRGSTLEREKILCEDTLARWVNGEVYPEQQKFFNLAKRLQLTSDQAAAILRLPGEPVLICATPDARALQRFFEQCDRIETRVSEMPAGEAQALARRLGKLADRARERSKCDSTTTEKGNASSTT